MPLTRRRSDRNLERLLDTRNASQTIANYFELCVELGLIIQLLKVATATSAEVRTWRLNTDWRGFENLFDGSKCHLAAQAIDPHPHNVAGRGQRDEQGQSFRMRQAET